MGPIRALLVEDNRATCALLRAFFEQVDGVEVCGEGYDGWEGLDLIQREAPDLVLLDLVMPGLDGMELLKALREEPPPKHPKIIVLSSVGSDEYVQRACQLGANYYLVKPVKLPELAARVSELFPSRLENQKTEGWGTWTLLRLGAKRTCLGFRYSCFALELLMQAKEPPLLKEIYLQIAREYNSSYACVEKNLRTIIRQIHTAGEPFFKNTLGFGAQEKPPDNGTFLRRLADELKRLEAEQ